MQPVTSTHSCLRCLATVGVLALSEYAFVSDHNGSGDGIGFEYYARNHFLVVEPSKDGAHAVKVISLPDLSNPRYIRHHEGWGSVPFSFTLENRVLTNFGSTSDSQDAETFTTVGTLGTAYGALLGTKITAESTKRALPSLRRHNLRLCLMD